MIDKQTLQSRANQYGVQLTDIQLQQLNCYAEQLVQFNSHTNITAITQPEDIINKHFVDSLLAVRFLPQGCSLIDVGTGAGFPGMVLKIARPDIHLTLLDSVGKKLEFLAQLSEQLDIETVLLNMRSEQAGRHVEHRERYDIATARAVSGMNVLVELCTPLVKVGGKLLALKGAEAANELQAAAQAMEKLQISDVDTARFALPDGSERNIVVVSKNSPTPQSYPRSTAAIVKRPL